MKIYIICPVRNASETVTSHIREYVASLKGEGHDVHFPTDDVDQSDPTGESICSSHAEAMLAADRVDVFWDSGSMGSHFDAGMAYLLHHLRETELRFVESINGDTDGKSYEKVLRSLEGKW